MVAPGYLTPSGDNSAAILTHSTEYLLYRLYVHLTFALCVDVTSQ